MTEIETRPLTIAVDADIRVSALFHAPVGARACYVFAHGAGAGMTHPFMAALAGELSLRGIATLRFQFPYMEKGGGRPDLPKLAHATVRAAVAAATNLVPELTLIAGGKSFGARMTSQAQALDPLPHVAGLAFVGFPLHPPKKLSNERAEHLFGIRVPMLFLQGTRDELCDRGLMTEVVDRLDTPAELRWFDDADHAFHVHKSSGSSDALVLAGLAQAIADFAARLHRG